jgi:hypothetical protein
LTQSAGYSRFCEKVETSSGISPAIAVQWRASSAQAFLAAEQGGEGLRSSSNGRRVFGSFSARIAYSFRGLSGRPRGFLPFTSFVRNSLLMQIRGLVRHGGVFRFTHRAISLPRRPPFLYAKHGPSPVVIRLALWSRRVIRPDQCKSCLSGKPAPLVPIGTPVTTGGQSQTRYEFGQCPACGSIWTTYEDSGRGGHGGPFFKLLFAPS